MARCFTGNPPYSIRSYSLHRQSGGSPVEASMQTGESPYPEQESKGPVVPESCLEVVC